MRQFTALAIAAALVLAACSGGADEATPTTPAPSTTAVATTSTATTASPPPTTTAPSTLAPTTLAPTTAPPSTALRDIVAEVTQAVEGTYDFYWACLREPSVCDPSAIAAPGSAALDGLTLTRDELISAGFFVGDADPGYQVIEGIDADGERAVVTSCWRLTAVLYGPPGPDGVPTVQNDTAGYLRQTDEYVLVNGTTWMISTSTVTEQVGGSNQCAPES